MTIIKENGIIKGASIPAIIEYFVNDINDVENLDHFFAAFPQFMDSMQVWTKWTEFCAKIPPSELKQELPLSVFTTQPIMPSVDSSNKTASIEVRPKTVRESTINFLWAWLERAFYRDFLQTKKKRNGIFMALLKFLKELSTDTSNRFKLLMIKAAHERKRRVRQIKLRSGVTTTTSSSPGANSGANTPPQRSSSTNSLNTSPGGSPHNSIGPGSMSMMMRELQAMSGAPPSPVSRLNPEATPPLARKALEPGQFEFVDLDALDVAQQLTVIEFETFKNIQESELYKLAWRSERKAKVAPNVCKLVERFNTVSYWVATEIVMVTTLRERVNILKKFVNVAEHLREMGNFNGVMEIIAGVNMWAVTRLKNSWEQLPKPAQTAVEQLNELMQTQNNYRNYRTALKSAKLPALPYLGIYLRDLTFINENDDHYDKEKGLFNFEKLKLIGQVITEMKRYQLSDYVFERNDVLQEYLTKLLTLPEEMLIKHSQLCEANSS